MAARYGAPMAPDSPPWRPIEPIPATLSTAPSPRLAALARQWGEERLALQTSGVEGRFIDEMKNRMATETGVIEGLYDLKQGVTETLIAEGFSAALLPHSETNRDPHWVIAVLRDQREAIDFVFDLVARRRPLSTSVIKELHALLTRHQPTTTAVDQLGNLREVPLLRGEWKTVPNNPTRPDGTLHAYCPPEQVGSEMDRLVDYYRQYNAIGTAPEVLASWLHHRFTQIHPFQDGNGRIARLLASVVFINRGWQPLVVLRDDRPVYIDALEKADAGSLSELIRLFISWQTRAFVIALGASHKSQQAMPTHLEDVLASIRHSLSERPQHGSDLEALADLIIGEAELATQRIATQLQDSVPKLTARADRNRPDRAAAYRQPRIDLARHSGFFADFSRASRWARIMIRPDGTEVTATLLVSTAAVGASVGTLAVTVGLITEDPETKRASTIPVFEDYFVATDADLRTDEDRQRIRAQFSEWVSHSLVLGLAQWRQELS